MNDNWAVRWAGGNIFGGAYVGISVYSGRTVDGYDSVAMFAIAAVLLVIGWVIDARRQEKTPEA
jgi:hypothetical protein